MKMKIKNNYIDIIIIVLIIIASIFKIKVGIDNDEGYIISLGARFLQGDHLFKEVWDLYQTCTLPIVFFMNIYKFFTGGLIGVAIFLRTITTIIQISVAILYYYILKPYYKNTKWVCYIIALITPRFSQNLCYGFCGFTGILLCIIIIFYISKNIDKISKAKLVVFSILSALSLSEALLGYPTFALTFIPISIFLLSNINKNKNYFKLFLYITVTCLLCATAYILFVLQNVTFDEMLHNFFYGMMSDESHNGGNMISSAIRVITYIRSDHIMVGYLNTIFALILLLFINKIKLFNIKINLLLSLLFVSSLAFILMNVTGLRYSGPLGMNLRWLLFALASFTLYFKYRADHEMFWLFGIVGIVMFFAVTLVTNLGLAATSSFLMITVLGAILLFGEEKNITPVIQNIILFVFIFSLIMTKGFTVRINGCGPANILEKREVIDFGVLKDIYEYPSNVKRDIEINQEFNERTTNDDLVLIMTNEPIYNLFGDFKFTGLTIVPDHVYSERWVSYYRDYDYGFPTKVFIDKALFTWDDLSQNNPLIKYLINYMKPDSFYESNNFYSFECVN